ncbi:MAG: DUF134 domain-containing protein [Chlorobium sp.]|jgi:predicted DNA-binding protein (UPF0251 family)|uniref:DUF134 domain-containing protein n=1 Tax=Chlorobium sp. TaxID=1095 RepID=UPI001DC59BE8|nr:DUF134 domain-containing protein [Chlorobium sp.]MBN1279508.1 DUF134 domain-containing protein [Chlorobiaceae bacterium]MCF8216249.1 DUF134 domain-containing protein [Chlorobium sp.]MCF8271151.1 DUF134 domain-containing protein [Chlorobium sp.]MCF8287525.1 DUF134 domain-containing protein [Chlorobium sp.]MCF8291064.1 DUF134 domain-containing protein [Chlorobium sp.]
MKQNRAGRPVSCRCIEDIPKFTCFKPEGIAPSRLQSVVLTVDEVEALRLADKLGLYQSDAASRMKVSRQTFGRIIESAHRKVAEAIIDGKSICVEGGNIEQVCGQAEMAGENSCVCLHCGFEKPHLDGLPCRMEQCPDCGKPLIRKGRCSSVA